MKKVIQKYIKDQIDLYNNYYYVQWHITSKCRENCKHCYLGKRGKYEFEYDHCLEIIDELKDLTKKNSMSIKIAFTGGDPLLHKDLFKIIEYCNKNGIQTVIKGMPNNLNFDVIKKLKSLNISTYNMSIDGNEEFHDSIRSNGSFKATLEKFRELNKVGIKTLLKFTVSKKNYFHLKDIINLSFENGINIIDFARLCPTNKEDIKLMLNDLEYKDFLLDVLSFYQQKLKTGFKTTLLFRDHLWFLLFFQLGLIDEDIIVRNKDRFIAGCSMGSKVFVINFNGDVLPCAKIQSYVIGNVYKTNIESILNSEKYNMLSKKDSYEDCRFCILINFCRGCPAISNAYYNNLFKLDPQCWLKRGSK